MASSIALSEDLPILRPEPNHLVVRTWSEVMEQNLLSFVTLYAIHIQL